MIELAGRERFEGQKYPENVKPCCFAATLERIVVVVAMEWPRGTIAMVIMLLYHHRMRCRRGWQLNNRLAGLLLHGQHHCIGNTCLLECN